jgi:hypothetical protein
MARGTLSNPFKQKGQTLGGQYLDFVSGGSWYGKALGIGSISESVRSKRAQREAEMADAEARLAAKEQAYQNFEFTTVNPYEDMTVNLQAAEFQRQQQAQEQADILASLRGSGGGSAGAAALATSLMRASAAKQQQISADISQQEQAIKMASAKAEMASQQAKQEFDINRMETILGMRMAEVTGLEQAEQARKDRNAQLAGDIIGGVTGIAGALI